MLIIMFVYDQFCSSCMFLSSVYITYTIDGENQPAPLNWSFSFTTIDIHQKLDGTDGTLPMDQTLQ